MIKWIVVGALVYLVYRTISKPSAKQQDLPDMKQKEIIEEEIVDYEEIE